jgi:hypothetical protein
VGRFADGIPSEIDGEPVMRPEDLADNEFAGDAPFLLGGWHGQDRWFGCGRVGETHPLLDDCSPEWIGDAPARRGPILMQARALPEGPVILRVHTNDVRSATCPERVRCAERLVVDELLWAGDAVTKSTPLQIGDVATAMDANLDIGVEAIEMDRTCLRPMPPVIWRATGTSRIGLILVYPTVEAREEAERHPPFISGCNGADVLIYVAPYAVVDNVIVYTKIDESTSDIERRALADSIAGWLREIPH